LICNPLNGTNNNVNTIIPTAPQGSRIYRWRNSGPNAQSFATDNYVTVSEGAPSDGWYDLSSGNPSTNNIAPGEAFFFNKVTPGNSTLTFVGEVPQGNLTNVVGTLNAFISSIVPQQATFTALGFPGRRGMIYQEWIPGKQGYGNFLNYLTTADGAPADGWYDLASSAQIDPTPAVGQGFVINNPTGSVQSWGRTFSVN